MELCLQPCPLLSMMLFSGSMLLNVLFMYGCGCVLILYLLYYDENDAKCKELGWICVPMVVEAYGAWGTEAMESFSLLASRLATSSNRAKAEVLAALYGRLNLNLVRVNATAILSPNVLSLTISNSRVHSFILL